MHRPTTLTLPADQADEPSVTFARAVVADELALVRLGVIAVLEPLGVDVVGEGLTARDVDAALSADPLDLVVIGRLADRTPAEAVRRLRRRDRPPRVVALVPEAARGEVRLLIALGTEGIAARSGRPEELAEVVEQVVRGERMVAPALHGSLVGGLIPVERSHEHPLTRREREVLALVAEGRSTREIASALSVTVATVKSHLVHLYAKLDAGTREEALARAVSLQLLG
ncbi:MAG TPA: response regulator transcription factor [Acidimicrobiia bacterium]|nr:response regulator transcription factor [Acidimicrobiia bacterium]